MLHTTTIEINGIATEVMIHFENRFGSPVIVSVCDEEGNQIAPDLLGEIDNNAIMAELREVC
jgi:hypothetical protein